MKLGNHLAMLVVCGVLNFGCSSAKRDASEIENVKVDYIDLHDVIRQTGDVRPVLKVDIKSEASGVIKRLNVKEGQALKKNDTILSIDPARLLYQKQRCDLAVSLAQISRDRALRDFEQNNELAATGSIASKTLADLKSEYELKDILVRQQELEQKDLADQLRKTVVLAPMSGVLTALNIEEGEIAVSATNGTALGTEIGTISNVSNLEVVSKIGEVDYVHVHAGDKVTIIPEAFDKTKTTGVITFVAQSAKKAANEELGTFEVRISVDSVIPGIASGINVNVEFLVLDKKHVIGIPGRFIMRRDNKSFVNLAAPTAKDKNATVEKEIVVGSTDFAQYEVVSGLSVGDNVVSASDPDEGKKGQKGKARSGGFGNVGRLSGRR